MILAAKEKVGAYTSPTESCDSAHEKGKGMSCWSCDQQTLTDKDYISSIVKYLYRRKNFSQSK
ncbi:MAG: hypothetical protein OCD76_25690 [Reichenbachiella sp.]